MTFVVWFQTGSSKFSRVGLGSFKKGRVLSDVC